MRIISSLCLALMLVPAMGLDIDTDPVITASDLGWTGVKVQNDDPGQVIRIDKPHSIYYYWNKNGGAVSIMIKKHVGADLNGKHTVEIVTPGGHQTIDHPNAVHLNHSHISKDGRHFFTVRVTDGDNLDLWAGSYEISLMPLAEALGEIGDLTLLPGQTVFGYNKRKGG